MEIGVLLRKIRGRDSLREAAKKTGLSHGFISIVEKGVDPRTRSPLKPSPDTLQAYAKGYHYSYDELMVIAGYAPNKKESAGTLPESEYERVIAAAEERYGVSLRDDPVVLDAVRKMIDIIAQERTKKDPQ